MQSNKKKKKRDRKPVDKSTVAQYKYFEELKHCLGSNWSSTGTREYLIERYGPDGVPSKIAIQRWRSKNLETLPRVIPHEVIEKKLKGVDYRVDLLKHWSRMVYLTGERMLQMYDVEEKSGVPFSMNDGVYDVYMRALEKYTKLAQDLGIVRSAPVAPLIDARTQQLNFNSPEMLKEIRDTLEDLKMVEARSEAATDR